MDILSQAILYIGCRIVTRALVSIVRLDWTYGYNRNISGQRSCFSRSLLALLGRWMYERRKIDDETLIESREQFISSRWYHARMIQFKIRYKYPYQWCNVIYSQSAFCLLFLQNSRICDPWIGSSRDFAGWTKRFYIIQIFSITNVLVRGLIRAIYIRDSCYWICIDYINIIKKIILIVVNILADYLLI